MEKCKNGHLGIEMSINLISGKWIPYILYQIALHETIRFNELHRQIPKITKKMLFMQLRELVYHNIVERKEYPQIPPKVEYSLTEHGKKLEPLFRFMSEWGVTHIEHMQHLYGEDFSYAKKDAN